mgnify:FL=1
MSIRLSPGLGELLRHVSDLVDQGALRHYQQLGLPYRPRYTPVLRALCDGAITVSDITDRTRLTQGAVSQTISLMAADGIIERRRLGDGRKSALVITAHGRKLLMVLEPHWKHTFAAIDQLEQEIGHPLRTALDAAAQALEQRDFATRLLETRQVSGDRS